MTYKMLDDNFVRLTAENMEDALRLGRLSSKIGSTTDFNEYYVEFHISQVIELI